MYLNCNGSINIYVIQMINKRNWLYVRVNRPVEFIFVYQQSEKKAQKVFCEYQKTNAIEMNVLTHSSLSNGHFWLEWQISKLSKPIANTPKELIPFFNGLKTPTRYCMCVYFKVSMFYSKCCVCVWGKLKVSTWNEYECNVKPKQHKTCSRDTIPLCVCVFFLCFFGKTNMEFCVLPIYSNTAICVLVHMENGDSKHWKFSQSKKNEKKSPTKQMFWEKK